MNTGIDQLTLNQIITFSEVMVAREFLATDKTELYAIQCIQRALESAVNFLGATSINDKQISELNGLVTDLNKKIQTITHKTLSVESVKAELGRLLSCIEKNTKLNQEPVEDDLLKDVVVFEKGEFGDQYDHLVCHLMYKSGVPYLNPTKKTHYASVNFKSSLLPGFARTTEEYERAFKQYKGCVDLLPLDKLKLLINDLNINLPSNSMILPLKEFVPMQVLIDLPRLSRLVINGQSLSDSTLRADKDALFCACIKAMEEEVDVTLAVMKLITQATLARPTVVLYSGFQFPETMTRVSQALDTVVSIRTHDNGKPLPYIEVRMWAYFGIIKGETKDPEYFLGVMRKLPCPRNFLISREKTKEDEQELEIMDVYSPFFPRLIDVKRCDFDNLGEGFKKEGLLLNPN